MQSPIHKLITQRPSPLAQETQLIAEQVHPLLARLLAARGVQSAAETQTELSALLPPQNMLGLAEAASLLADAITQQKRLLIVADYDCDGATACAVGVRGLRMLGAQVQYLVPNRFEYGYGLTPEIVDLALSNPQYSPELLITVDNGIASVEGVAHANARGLGVLVTDHHLPGPSLPAALAIVNPNQVGCPFPSKNIAGVGVMFYVLLATRAELRRCQVLNAETQPRLDTLLDLVALGTVADVVRLDRNNRILVAQGLQRMRAGRMQPGIAALFQVAGRQARRATAFDLGFGLGPRLNAAGRLADMSLGIECLLADDPVQAMTLAQQLDSMNLERRQIEAEMQESAQQCLAEMDTEALAERTSITLFDPDWHQGVIGILASRIKDQRWRPTIAFAAADELGEVLKGSGRSIPGVHLRDVLDLVSKQAPGVILKFGGHAMAAGLTIVADGLDEFEQAFEQAVQDYMASQSGENILQAKLETDGSLEEGWFQAATVQLLDSQVWGQGFPAPLFCNRFKIQNQRILKDKHLKLVLETPGGTKLDGIWFGRTESLPNVTELAFRLALDEYQGLPRVQVMVEGAR